MYDFIHINYDEMHQVANKFGKKAGDVSRMIGSTTAKANTAMAHWTGLAEAEYLAQYKSCNRRMTPIPGRLRIICDGIHDTANRVAEAEERARREYNDRIWREQHGG